MGAQSTLMRMSLLIQREYLYLLASLFPISTSKLPEDISISGGEPSRNLLYIGLCCLLGVLSFCRWFTFRGNWDLEFNNGYLDVEATADMGKHVGRS